MTSPSYRDDWLEVWSGDCRDVLDMLPSESVQTLATSPPFWSQRSYLGADHDLKSREIGGEKTPFEFVETIVGVMRKARRVLHSTGTAWINIADTYMAERGGTPMPAETMAGGVGGHGDDETYRGRGVERVAHRNARAVGIGHKNLALIPSRLAIALQDDGWVVRSIIIWSKDNPLPESVSDRPSTSHEYVLLLAKQAKYYYDAAPLREPHTDITLNRIKYGLHQKHPEGMGIGIPPVNVEEMGTRFAHPGGRNKRTVWSISTANSGNGHYAVWPEALVTPMILAGTPEKGVCPVCRCPWTRLTEVIREPRGDAFGKKDIGEFDHGQGGRPYEQPVEYRTIGWEPTCDHVDQTPIPATVLDPFLGSGTTLLVAQRLGRRGVGIELNPEYVLQSLRRNQQVPLGLSGVLSNDG